MTEKLGYQAIVTANLIKLEKIPAYAQNWMGIQEFSDHLEYIFLCMILMFLEERDSGEQFVLSMLTEYIQGNIKEEQIDWTIYNYRRHLVKVMKYCVKVGILEIDDGSEDNFMKSDEGEVLYQNTGASRYFRRIFLVIFLIIKAGRFLKRRMDRDERRSRNYKETKSVSFSFDVTGNLFK